MAVCGCVGGNRLPHLGSLSTTSLTATNYRSCRRLRAPRWFWVGVHPNLNVHRLSCGSLHSLSTSPKPGPAQACRGTGEEEDPGTERTQ